MRHVLEVTYRYVPADTQRSETGLHQVDPSTCDRVGIGSPVKVRYAPSRFLRSLHIVALRSVLADVPWRSRLPHDSEDQRLYFDLFAMVLVALLGFMAWRTRNHALILAAVFCGTVMASAIVPVGFIAFPLLFAAWRKWPGKGLGLALLAAMAVFIPVLHWRTPHNPPLPHYPSGPIQATVRQISTVHRIWSGRESGQDIPQPFQMVLAYGIHFHFSHSTAIGFGRRPLIGATPCTAGNRRRSAGPVSTPERDHAASAAAIW